MELRLKKQTRGWYTDKEPAVHGLNQAFKDVDKPGVREALGKFGLLDDCGNPVNGLTDLMTKSDFGYGEGDKNRQTPKARNEKTTWGPAGGLTSGNSDMVGATSGRGNGGV